MKYLKKFKNYEFIKEEDGNPGGGAGQGSSGGTAVGGGDSSSTGGGDVSATGGTTPVSNSGVAYFNQGNVSGMGNVQNSTVSNVPGDPSFSQAGSGDVSVSLPSFVFTKNSGATGNKQHKRGSVKVDKELLTKPTKVKDKLGSGVKSFQQFVNY